MVGAILQARMSSERLPGKVLRQLPAHGGRTLVEHIVARATAAQGINRVVLATSTRPENDVLAELGARLGIPVFRGSEDDVLDRFQQAATTHNLSHIVRLTGDNPFLDCDCLATAISEHLASGVDVTVTTGLPLGMNIEIISAAALARAAEEATRPEDREHVTLYCHQHPTLFRIRKLDMSQGSHLDMARLTIDCAEDYDLASFIYDELYAGDHLFGFRDIARLIASRPDCLTINQHIRQHRGNWP